MSKPTPEQIADGLLAPTPLSTLWTHDQVRALIIEAAQSAPLATQERQRAWAALRMVRDAMEELFGPLAAVRAGERSREYHHEAEAIIEGLQRVATRLNQGR